MAGSDVAYDTAPTVAPSTTGGPSPLSVRATPNDFGAQKGAALEGVGGQLTQTQDQAFAYAQKRQGMVNESLATNAETEYETGKAGILNDYRSKEGLTAVAAQQKAEADLVALREQIAGKLPNDFAQKAFRTLTNKSQAYGISDIGTYASGQVKKADTDSATASVNNSVAASNSYPVASDDDRFGDTLHTIKFQTARQVVNQGYGPDGGTGMTQDPATGDVSFDETKPQGQAAKAVYQNQLDKASGMAWENRIKTLADDPTNGNITRALKVFNDNRDSIPAETEAKLSAYLTPKVRSVQSLGLAQTQLSYAEHGYQSSVGQAGSGDIHQAILGQESHGNDNAATSITGATGPMQVQPDTFTRFAKPGEDIHNPADNRAVGNRYVDYLAQLPNVAGDPARIAVGYFSGEKNIAPPESSTPYIADKKDPTGKSTSSYVADVLKRTGGGPQSDPSALAKAGPSQFQSRADYYNANYDTIVQNTRADAQRLHPDDPQFEEQSVAHVEQQMRGVMHQEASLNKSNSDVVYQALGGAFTNGARPATLQQLETASPETKSALDSMQVNDPVRYNSVTKLLTANSGGKATNNGNQFTTMLNRVLAPDGDPSRISDAHALDPYVKPGNNAAVTNIGFSQLSDVLAFRAKQGGEAATAQLRTFMNTMHGQLSFSNDRAGVRDVNGEKLFENFASQALPIFMKGDPAKLLDPKSPDYLGKLAPQRTPADRLKDFMHDVPATVGGHALLGQFSQLKDTESRKQALKDAVHNGTISRDEGVRIGVEMGYIVPHTVVK